MRNLLAILTVGLVVSAAAAAEPPAETNLLTGGSLEFWLRHNPENFKLVEKGQPPLDGPEALVPRRWTWSLAKPSLLRRTTDAHGGSYALAVASPKGARDGSLSLSYLEVNPGSSYSFGVWAKGTGKLAVRVFGKAFEGDQELAKTSGTVGPQWQKIGGKVTVPGHIRLVTLVIGVPAPCEVVLDDAYISAPLDAPYDADAVLAKKYGQDADTLLLEDFDGPTPALILNDRARIIKGDCPDFRGAAVENGTVPLGGRFGRGLRLDRPASAAVPVKIAAVPAEGTLEFWLSPDGFDFAGKIDDFLAVCKGSEALAHLTAGTDHALTWSWHNPGATGASVGHWLSAPNSYTLLRMRPGQWFHVAVTWDPTAVRYYVDGVLVELHTAQPLRWNGVPTTLILGGLYDHQNWNGAIDEIRLSKVKRYGPHVPKGDKFVKIEKPARSAARPAGSALAAERPKPKLDVAAERKKLLGSIGPTRSGQFETQPNPQGDFIYEATTAKPLVDTLPFVLETLTGTVPVFAAQSAKMGLSPSAGEKGTGTFSGLKARKMSQSPGDLTTAKIAGARRQIDVLDNVGLYWKLGAIPAGKYWLGVFFESQGWRGHEAPAPTLGIYLNGRLVQCSTMSDPVQVSPGVWFAEIQAAAAEMLRAGDEISVSSMQETRIARLVLHPKEPARGAHRVAINFGGNWGNFYTTQYINACAVFVNAKGEPFGPAGVPAPEQRAESAKDLIGKDGVATSYCYLANPLPVSVTVDYGCVVKNYYRYVLGREKDRLTLPPHSRIKRSVGFHSSPDERSVSIEVSLKAVNVPDLGWPATDMVSFFPGVRQLVPWTESFGYRDVKRLVFDHVPSSRAWHGFVSLAGGWEVALTTNLKPAVPAKEKLAYKPCTIPVFLNLEGIEPRPHAAYMKKTFELPEDCVGQAHRLFVCDVTDEATAYLNGKKVGNVKGNNAFLVADVTGVVKPGWNELIVVVRDLLAIMNPAYVNPKAPAMSPNYLDAPGLGGTQGVGLSKVWLESAPLVAVQDIAVVTSVRQKKIEILATVVNHSLKPAKVAMAAHVFDPETQSTVSLDFHETSLTVEAGKSVDVRFQAPWEKPRLWSLTDPHMYLAGVFLVDAASGALWEGPVERFGFRESWIEGPNIYFNGIPVRLKGCGTPAPVGNGMRGDFNLARSAHVADHIGHDYLDEWGCLTSLDITAIWNTPSKHNVERDAFWQNATKNMLTSARLMQNHPSIVAWDLSNEWLWYLGYTGAESPLAARRFKTLADTLAKHDPTRWSLFDGDGDLIGLHDNWSFHYMNPYSYGYVMNNHAPYYPDGAYWGPLEKPFDPAADISLCPFLPHIKLHPEKKCTMDSENLWKVDKLMPPGLTRYVGEEDVLSPAVDSGAGPIAWYWKTNLDGHRDLGLAMNCYYGHITGTSRRGYMLQTFILPDMVHHGFSSRPMKFRYTLLNDVFHSAKLDFHWRLLGPDGNVVDRGGESCKLPSAGMRRGWLNFTLPAVDKRTKYVLDLRLEADGQFVYGEERDIEVWPEQPIAAGSLARSVLLFDPASKTVEVLKAARVPFARCDKLALPAGSARGVLMIVGEDALTETTAPAVASLDKFVAGGGRLLIMAQMVNPRGLPAASKLEPREWAAQCFLAVPTHPILRGFTDWDLHFWAADRAVGRGAYTKPDGGPATPLVHSGAIDGMEWVQLMELYRGEGLYMVCQLPLVAKYSEEPMARELLARTLDYLAGPESFRRPVAKLKAIIAPDSAVEKRLAEVGVSYEIALPESLGAPPKGTVPFSSNENRDGPPVLVDAGLPATSAQRAAWAGALNTGATIVVCNAQPSDTMWLSELAGRPVTLTVPRYSMWGGRGYRTGYDQPVAGLSQVDLYWKRYAGTEDAGSQAEDPSLAIQPFQDFAVTAEDAKELVFPGAMLEMKVGSGRLIIDQRRWMTADEKLLRPTARVLSALALGLGVEVAPVVVPRSLPPHVSYRTIELGEFATRGFIDPVADDGRGGWTDQGPEADLRTFPTGPQSFGGVPFAIGKEPKCCIVLNSDARPHPKLLPPEVTIPVGHRVEGFYFLHASAYTPDNGYIGLYQVKYADGTTADIPLYGEVNIRDWISPVGPFVREKGTTSSVAWTGSCPTFREIAVYKMLWVNPRPEAVVKAVRFANPARIAVPVLLGLTAVVPQESHLPQSPASVQQARKLLAEALDAVKQGQDRTAEKLLKQTLAADPSLTAAHQALGDLCERAGNEDAALQIYRDWVQAGADTPLPYNRVGQILEKRKDYRGALEVYAKSLKVEWNQPPIIEAKARLEKLLTSER
jgi:hypothetical protein